MIYEYETCHFGTNSDHWLHNMGKHGWELVSLERYNPGPGMTCVFKRPLPVEESPTPLEIDVVPVKFVRVLDEPWEDD